ncbi:MAG: OmpP1/FadL family transporter [bacterium]
MRPSTRHALPVAIALCIAGFSQHASASGFAIIEHSASGMGNAFAGAAAIAEDASTAWFNPAGLTKLKNPQLVVSGHIIAPKADYQDEGSSVNPALTGGVVAGSLTGKNDDGGSLAFVPNLYYARPINDSMTFGFAMNAPFGLETNYDDDWVGRYHGLKSAIETINLNPSIGWQVSDNFSLGFGVSAQYVHAQLTSAIDSSAVCLSAAAGDPATIATCGALGIATPSNSATDSFADLETDNWAFGFNFGALFDVNDSTRLGLSYRSEITQDTSGTADFTVNAALQPVLTGINAQLATVNQALLKDSDINASVTLPQSVSLSMTHQYNNKLQVLADITWTGWSSFDELRIKYDSGQSDSVTTENWDDVFRYSIGANYKMDDKLTLRGGLALDQEAIPDTQHRTPRIPGNDRTWVSLGAGYNFSAQAHFDVGYSHLFVDETPTDHTDEGNGYTLRGKYDASVDILSAQLTWNF